MLIQRRNLENQIQKKKKTEEASTREKKEEESSKEPEFLRVALISKERKTGGSRNDVLCRSSSFDDSDDNVRMSKRISEDFLNIPKENTLEITDILKAPRVRKTSSEISETKRICGRQACEKFKLLEIFKCSEELFFGLKAEKSSELIVLVEEKKDKSIVLFKFGTVVFWNFTLKEEKEWMEKLVPFHLRSIEAEGEE